MMQVRFLGGVIGLALATSIQNHRLETELPQILGPQSLAAVLQSTDGIAKLSGPIKEAVIVIFAKVYNLQYKVMIAFAAAQLPAGALIWRSGNQVKAG
jgi:hypothetical protein